MSHEDQRPEHQPEPLPPAADVKISFVAKGCVSLPMLLCVAALFAALFLAGCGQCQPAAAYTVPAHWDQAYDSEESYVAYYSTRYSCSYWYDSYGERHRSCTSYQHPHYNYYTDHHPAVYHPEQYVPAVACPAKQ